MIATASKHLAFLLACLVSVACGGSEAPRAKRTSRSSDESSESDTPRKKKKKKKKPAPVVAEAEPESDDDEEREREERRERMRKREQEKADAAAETDEKPKSKAEANGSDDDNSESSVPSEEDEIEKRREKERKRARAAFGRKDDAEEGTETSSDEPAEDEEDAADRKRRKAAEAKRAAADKKRAAAEERKEAAARKREEAARKKEEARRKRDEAAEAKRAAAEAKKAEEDEKKRAEDDAKKKKKAAEPAEDAETETAATDESEEEEKPAPKKAKATKGKKKATKASKKKPVEDEPEAVAEVDLTDEAEPAKQKQGSSEPPKEEEEEDSKPIDFEKIEADDDPLKQKRVAAISVPGVDDESGAGATDAPATAAAVPLVDRPLTLHKGGIEAHGGMRVNTTQLVTNSTPPMKVSKTTEALMFGGSYGLSDKAEVGFDYAISVNPGSIKGPLTLRGAYSLAHGKLDAAVAGALAIDFLDVPDAMMNTVSHTFASLQLGAWVRYHAGSKLALFTGLPALPPSGVGLLSNTGLPPLQYQLAVGINENQPIALSVPIGAGYQLAPSFYAALSLNLGTIAISNGKTQFAFADFIPLSLSAFYSTSKLDVGFALGDDAQHGTDALRFDMLLRYSVK